MKNLGKLAEELKAARVRYVETRARLQAAISANESALSEVKVLERQFSDAVERELLS